MEPQRSCKEPSADQPHGANGVLLRAFGLSPAQDCQTVYVVLPNKARKFCEAEGIKTKTDAMDACCLALMGCVSRKLKPWSPPAATCRESRQTARFHADLC